MSGFGDPAFFGDRYAHEYDERTVLDPAPAVEFLAGLVPAGGRVLELAVGTGRVAVPLAARGIDVEGIDGSAAMIERMRAKPGGASIATTVGDMADVTATGPFELVYLVFNTLFNLPSLSHDPVEQAITYQYNGWDRSPFTAASRQHVSVYERP